jgi:predicted signal transduction protein with EAL and GGDEF domain
LDEGRLPARCLEIDLTDATLRDTLARDAAALRRIRALGVGIALSDFGMGYSSLAMLEQTPLTRIKLDRSLANALEAGPRLPIIARNLVDWARRVGLRVAPAELAVGEELANALRHFVHLDRSEEGTTAIDGQHETGAYGSFIVFRDSFALKEVAQGRGAGGVTRAATGVD